MFVYADNAATTSVSRTALNAMMPYLTDMYGNPSSLYAFAQKVTALGAFTLARGDVTFRIRAHAAFGHFNTAIASR